MKKNESAAAVMNIVIAGLCGVTTGGVVTWLFQGNWLFFRALALVVGVIVCVIVASSQRSAEISEEEENLIPPQRKKVGNCGWNPSKIEGPRPGASCPGYGEPFCMACPYLYAARDLTVIPHAGASSPSGCRHGSNN